MRTSLPNLEHWMPLECGETSRQTAHPTLHWWQQQYAAGRWCRAAGFPGGTVFSLQGAPPERLCSLHWYDRTSGRQWLSHDSACLEGAAKRPGCPLDCGWSGWALGHGEELQVDKTAGIRMKEFVKANHEAPFCALHSAFLGDLQNALVHMKHPVNNQTHSCYCNNRV